MEKSDEGEGGTEDHVAYSVPSVLMMELKN